MARPKKTDSTELMRIVDAYFTTEAAGNPALLKCSLLEKYACKAGSKAKAYDFRRDEQVRKRMDELREIAGNEAAPIVGKDHAYKSLDINRILGVRRDPDELARVLGEIDQGWKKVYDEAVRSSELIADLQLQARDLKTKNEAVTQSLEESEKENKKLRGEARRLEAENRYLRKMLREYLYPALANEILVEENQIQNPDTQVTEKAREELIDGKIPSGVSAVVSRDVSEIKNVDDAMAAMWAGIGGE